MQTKAIIFSGNITGAGKTTVSRKVLERQVVPMRRIISYATRIMRPGEVDGVDYHFISTDEFMRRRDEGAFHEFTDEIPGRFYGVPQAPIDEAFNDGVIPCFVTDFRGIENLADVADTVVKLWVTAPYEQLVARINDRETDPGEIAKRLRALEDDGAWFNAQRPKDLCLVPNPDGKLSQAVRLAEQFILAA